MKTLEGRKIYTPAELNYFARETLEQMVAWVEAEVSEVKKHPSMNFYYLTLKDDKAVLPCIASGFVVEAVSGDINGKKVLAFGNLTLYEPFGKYQLRLSKIELSGDGDLNKKLDELVRKLRAEGLFDSSFKQTLPPYPKKIGLLTSVGSDAWKDFHTHCDQKIPFIDVIDFDTRVQGTGAVKSILYSLDLAEKQNLDILAITRGGGSLEDLAAFNSEEVARAIFNLKTPTVVAIGHEANESLAEWVADVRCSTPTDAAHTITANWRSVLEKLSFLSGKLIAKKEKLIDSNLEKLDYIFSKLLQTKNKTILLGEKLESYGHSLKILSPQNTLERGYSIVFSNEDKVIKSAKNVVVGDTIKVKLAQGQLTSKVQNKNE